MNIVDPAMLERAAKALYDMYEPFPWNVAVDAAVEALTAALEGCEIREEWAYRSLWSRVPNHPDPPRPDQLNADGDFDGWVGTREQAMGIVARVEGVPRAALRRLKIITPFTIIAESGEEATP